MSDRWWVRRGSGILSAVCSVALALGGCASGGKSRATPDPTKPAPPYESVAARYNERAARLGRVWANAVVVIDFVDESGRNRREQGEGHLQYVAPNNLALSAGKLGETMFWLGCDAERFWWFDLDQSGRAAVGRHENFGQPCCRPLDLPVHPLDIVELLGITLLPAGGESRNVSWSADGTRLLVDAASQVGRIRLALDPKTYEPLQIEILSRDGDPLVIAELREYGPVNLRGVGGVMPRMASRIAIRTPGEDGALRLRLAAMSDGKERQGRLAPENFDFEALNRVHRPGEIIVLDEGCDTPAMAPFQQAP